MTKRSASFIRLIIIPVAVVAAISLYCIDIISTAIFANESMLAVNSALERETTDPLSEPEVAPLLDIMRRDKSDTAAQNVQSLVDLRAAVGQSSIKEFSDRLQSTKAKMTFGVSEPVLIKWRSLAEEAQQPPENHSDEKKKQIITTLRQEVNKAIVLALVSRPPQSTLNQYLFIKKIIPALPELSELFSNKELNTE